MAISAASSWLKNPGTSARYRLFCFPYAGGGASAYHTWQASFSSEIEICPVQLPGRENRITERPFDELPLLVQAIADVVLCCGTPRSPTARSRRTYLPFA